MQLSLQTFATLVQGMAASVQAVATQLLDLSVGSTLRAILEASASVALWMQWLILQVLQMTRAATSNGPDLDSWMGDFSLTRLPSNPATGVVTFSRYTSTATALVPAGALARTIDGSQTFVVTTDTTAPGWNQTFGGYLLGIEMASLDVPVVAQAPGICGNVQAGSITILATALPGVDNVSNAAAFTNGVDAESDIAFRQRFQSFMSSRSRATLATIEYAITSVQQGLCYTIQENQNALGEFQLGNFIVVIDDGSGFPSDTLLSAVRQSIDAVRPVGSTFAVFAPTVTQVNVSLTIELADGISANAVSPLISDAIAAYINALSVGASLPATRIAQIAYSVNSGITNVTNVLLNGQALDLEVHSTGILKSGIIVVD